MEKYIAVILLGIIVGGLTYIYFSIRINPKPYFKKPRKRLTKRRK
jgi:hypothetical protein